MAKAKKSQKKAPKASKGGPASSGKKAKQAKPKTKAVKAPKAKLNKGAEGDRTSKVEKLLLKGKERGFVTYDEILKEFPTIEEDIAFLDELYGKFQSSGIDVLEGGNMLEKEAEEPAHKKNVYVGKSSDSSYD